MRQVALLRAVNVAGKNKVSMAALRTLFESLGCTDVQTYIQSGNVVFGAARATKAAELERAIAGQFGFEVDVAVRSAAQLAKALEENPFPDADTSKLYVGFLFGNPDAEALDRLDADRFAPAAFALRRSEVYLHLPDGMGRATLPVALGRALRVPWTVRNWKTVRALAEMAARRSVTEA